MPDDDRVITLKLLDRLHNMRTIEYVDSGKQLSRSQETLELLVPHAQRLGLQLSLTSCRQRSRPKGFLVKLKCCCRRPIMSGGPFR